MNNANDEDFIKIENLTKYYDNGQIKALNGINLDITKGSFISIIGPSGSGKSTLLNMIGGLDIPDSGNIKVFGKDLYQEKDLNKYRSSEVGFIFQFHNLIPNLSVLENIEIPLLETNCSEKEQLKRAQYFLKMVQLEDKLNKKPNELSGGQRQRVAIARALINNPSIILADEPTGSLDSKTSKIILDLLKTIHKKENVTLIIITHDLNVAKQANRTVEVLDGKIVVDKKTYNI